MFVQKFRCKITQKRNQSKKNFGRHFAIAGMCYIMPKCFNALYIPSSSTDVVT